LHLLPRELCLFDYFEAHAAKTVEGCQLFLDLACGAEEDVANVIEGVVMENS